MISKETNTIIKGIAVLMMLFLHLFNGQILDFYPELQELPYRPLCYLDGQPLEYIITRCCRPVPFFFILSGYGMSILYKKNRLSYHRPKDFYAYFQPTGLHCLFLYL